MEQVTLGKHTLDVYPQKHAYITNKVGKTLAKVVAAGVDIQEPQEIYNFFLGEGAYPLLAAMMPIYAQRCPQYEFMGFGSKEAWDAGDYDENTDDSPSYAELITAFEVVARVNRFDVLKVLKGVVDPKALRAQFTLMMSEAMETRMSISGPSATEQSENGGSETSTPSGTTPPTSTLSEV